MIRILISDDHAILRQGLKQILADEIPQIEFGEAGEAAETLALLHREKWDLLILDVNMPGRNGFEVLTEVRRSFPHVPVLVLSSVPEDQIGLRVIRGGAAGYLNKQIAPERLVEAVQTALRGECFISPALAQRLAAEVALAGSGPRHELLSARELQVFHLSAAGKAVKEIAAELSLSAKTISTFRSRIFQKLGLKNDIELARYAREHGLAADQ
ncbi:MAG: response regulator transcription factor [Opitutaceae bacterium]|nr:response regulator transcription factor [Opitutaceae bacterium]